MFSCTKKKTDDEIIIENSVSNDETMVSNIAIPEMVLNVQASKNTDNILSHLSLNYQYNTLTDAQGANIRIPLANTHHYFFGFNEYSNAIIIESEYNSYTSGMPEIQWTLQFASSTGNQFITFGGGDPESISSNMGISYSFSGGQINNWYSYGMVSYDIEYTDNNEIYIKTKDTSDGSMPTHLRCYINIPREELLEKYLRLYLEGIDYILDKTWETRRKQKIWPYERLYEKEYDNDERILESLDGRTVRELAIFKNYIYARHNHDFHSDEWNDFFRTYYKNDYSGTRTIDEVMDILTEHEKHVLDLVTQQSKEP
jgi:hypothetical protein